MGEDQIRKHIGELREGFSNDPYCDKKNIEKFFSKVDLFLGELFQLP